MLYVYIVGAIITFIVFVYAEIEAQKDPDNPHWMVGAVAITAATVVWPLSWLAVLVVMLQGIPEDEDDE